MTDPRRRSEPEAANASNLMIGLSSGTEGASRREQLAATNVKILALLLVASLAACGGTEPPPNTGTSAAVDACDLLMVGEVEAALGMELTVDRETQPQEWICNWTTAERGLPIAQLLVTPAAYSTFEEFREDMESDPDLDAEVLPVAGVGEWAAWTFDAMLYAKQGGRAIQLTIFSESTVEVARPLVQLAVDRLPD
jgi:hypothetical protein